MHRILRHARALLLVAVLVAHLPSLGARDFHYDDGHSLVRNPHLRLEQIPRFFGDATLFSERPADAMYRPLVLTAHALNRATTPGTPAGFLALNLLIHAAVVLLLHALLARWLPGGAALGASLLFAVHPLQSEAVNYISARSESLAALGVLIALLGGSARPAPGRLAATAAGQLLAVASKATGIVAPALLALARWSRRQPVVVPGLWVSAVVSAIYLIVRQLVGTSTQTAVEPVRGALSQAATQTKALAHYLRAAVVPVDLSVAPQFRESPSPGEIPVVVAALFVLSLGWLLLRRRGPLLVGAAWWMVCLAPTLVVPLNVLVNDHRPYLALAGLVMIVAALRPALPRRLVGPGVTALAILAMLSAQRALEWKTEISLWESAVREGLQVAEARHNLALAYHQAGRHGAAQEHYEAAVRLRPDYVRPLTNLGALYREAGRLVEAERLLRQALAVEPASVEALNNLGLVLTSAGRPADAIALYRRALEVDGAVAELWLNLGLAQRDAGRREEAFRSLQRALQLDPSLRQRLGGG
jgi:hypothetical protein